MNSITIKGRLTRDPELKTTGTGKEVAKFAVAVNRRFDNKKTDFFDCQAWGKTGVFLNTYFRKGQEILLNGEMQRRTWDGEDGKLRVAWELNVENAEFCGSKNDASAGSQERTTVPAGDVNSFMPGADSDLPF